MPEEILIQVIMPIVLIAAVTAACYCYQIILQNLPAKQRATIDHIVSLAVARTEQIYTTLPHDEKKQIATRLVEKMFSAFHLETPPSIIIEAAIEAAVFLLPDTYTHDMSNVIPIEAAPKDATTETEPNKDA